MAGSTTNIGLIKPTYSEDADVAIINENMDTLDSTISALDNGLAIVSNNNTHGAITAGQYVYVRNHGSLAEGMYTANSNIAANATLSSSNLTAVSSGSLNKLNSDISALNNNKCSFETGSMTISCSSGLTRVSYSSLPSGKPSSEGKFKLSFYMCVNHGSASEQTQVCVDGTDLLITTATAQNTTIRWWYIY